MYRSAGPTKVPLMDDVLADSCFVTTVAKKCDRDDHLEGTPISVVMKVGTTNKKPGRQASPVLFVCGLGEHFDAVALRGSHQARNIRLAGHRNRRIVNNFTGLDEKLLVSPGGGIDYKHAGRRIACIEERVNGAAGNEDELAGTCNACFAANLDRVGSFENEESLVISLAVWRHTLPRLCESLNKRIGSVGAGANGFEGDKIGGNAESETGVCLNFC
jgi:hypothetical protein